jgi:hypothetical protein
MSIASTPHPEPAEGRVEGYGRKQMQVCGVHPAHVAGIWPQVSGFIVAAMRLGYDQFYGEADIQRACMDGSAQLWVACSDTAIEAAVVSRIVRYPKRSVCQVPLIGGRRMRAWLLPMQTMIEDYARVNRCTHMEGSGRLGWCRAAGYQDIGPVLMKELSA